VRVAGAGEAASAEERLAAAHAALLKTPGLQFDFGAAPKAAPSTLPPWLVEFLRAIAPAMGYVFWAGVVLAALAILVFLARELLPERWFRRKRATPVATDWRPAPEQARALLEDADGLAAAGRFEEAIHLLLFRSIDELAAAAQAGNRAETLKVVQRLVPEYRPAWTAEDRATASG